MNILITGASGLIGSAIVEKLSIERHSVFGLSRSLKKDNSCIKWVQHDLYKDPISSLHLPEKIDVVYHLAGQTSVYVAKDDPIADLNSNVIALLNLLEYFKSIKQIPFVVLAGTATEVGLVDVLPINEETQDHPITFYDLSKLTAEIYLKQYIREGWVRGCTLRLANVFGRSQKGQKQDRGILDKIFSRAIEKQDIIIFGDGEYIRDYIFIEDAVNAFLSAPMNLSEINGKHFIIGSGEGKSIAQAFALVAERVKEKMGISVSTEHKLPPADFSPIESRNFIADSRKFKQAAGWDSQYSIKKGIDLTLQKYSSGLKK